MNVPIDRDELIEYGKAIAKLDTIENIVRYSKYDSDAVKAIKCVLGVTDEKEDEE